MCLIDYITAKESNSLKEIRQYNPLLFDFVLKRTGNYPVPSGVCRRAFS
jgi:hypothetical protein